LLAVVFSHIQYCGYAMPITAMTYTSRNLQNNSNLWFEATSEHVALTISSMAIWLVRMHMNINISKTSAVMKTILLASNVEC
jgi:hypothetical protein